MITQRARSAYLSSWLLVAALAAFAGSPLPSSAGRAGVPAAVGAPVGSQGLDRQAGRAAPLFGTQYRGNWGYTDAQRVALLHKLRAAGVQWLRIGITWAGVQPRRPTANDHGLSHPALRRIDEVVREAHVRGFKVSVTFGSTPRWASGGGGPLALPTHPGSYARIARKLAARYRGEVQSWEVYNEPNLAKKLNATPAAYTKLLCTAYPAFHRAVGDIKVISGGTSGNDWEFVKRMYASGGKGCFDVLATHAYQAEARSPYYPSRSDHRWWFQNIRLVHDVMVRHSDGRTPVWFTETGWSTHRDVQGFKDGVTLQQQADYLEQLLRITKRRYPYVARLSWFMARNESYSDIQHNNFGLYHKNLDPKPAARRLERLLTG